MRCFFMFVIAVWVLFLFNLDKLFNLNPRYDHAILVKGYLQPDSMVPNSKELPMVMVLLLFLRYRYWAWRTDKRTEGRMDGRTNAWKIT